MSMNRIAFNATTQRQLDTRLRLRKAIRTATWNVRTLLQEGGCEQLALSLLQYRVDVACLQELQRLPGYGSIDLRIPHPNDPDDSVLSHRLLFSGPRDGSGQAGVGIAVTQSSQVLLWKPSARLRADCRRAHKSLRDICLCSHELR